MLNSFMFTLYLASQSPRRRQLLENAQISFKLLPVNISEKPVTHLTPEEQIRDIAERKAKAAWELLSQNEKAQPFAVLSADTEVVLDQQLLGKPASKTEARQMLKDLSGRTHEVKTAVVLWGSWSKTSISHVETTKIFFKKLTDAEIEEYISTEEPYDKAGGYGIQGVAGKYVEKIEGSYSNVVGLPMEAVESLLKKLELSQH